MKPLTVYGAAWCADCRYSKRFLDEQNVPYNWIDIEHDSEAAETVVRLTNGYRRIPTIVFPDQSILIEPSNQELAKKLSDIQE